MKSRTRFTIRQGLMAFAAALLAPALIFAAVLLWGYSTSQREQHEQDARNAATGEEAYYLDSLAYFSGDCSLLPGVNTSPGVSCTATATSGGFEIATSHPSATVSCVFQSAGTPNLNCTTITP